ncbi:MAG: tannase/feruloyl esterase family alpha/beta hydrolase [Gammaproteobacteria bacterium]|nr:tannase/feruloyl esterase family alpha/beta hydrolase [Gammaproteobacteria bacterium]
MTGLVGGKIGFKVSLPAAWNGRFVMGGAGGFVNVDANQALQFFGERILTDG